MKTTRYVLALALSFIALALPAKADQLENLLFTGFATCLDANCSSFGSGAVTGTYTLDVNTQTVVGPWSFSTPFGSISSTQVGAQTLVDFTPPPAGAEQENAYFQINSGVPGGFDFIWLFFPNTDLSQTGPIDPTTSTLCIPLPTPPVACRFDDYALTGSNVATAEPSTVSLLGTGLFGLMGMGLYKRRLA